MEKLILDLPFFFVTALHPERDSNQKIREYLPEASASSSRDLLLNPHGKGPFCRFRIPNSFPFEGVYAITVGADLVYLGKCQNLSARFNSGYGSIQPRNRFWGGQSTNCRLNTLILSTAKHGREIRLWFHRSADRDALERRLLQSLRPAWNLQLGRVYCAQPTGTCPPEIKTHTRGSLPLPSESTMPVFKLTLHKTYIAKGFFNITLEYDQYVSPSEGPIELLLGTSAHTIQGRIDRSSNLNGTPRIHGGTALRDWFRRQHQLNDVIDVDLISPDRMKIG